MDSLDGSDICCTVMLRSPRSLFQLERISLSSDGFLRSGVTNRLCYDTDDKDPLMFYLHNYGHECTNEQQNANVLF